jgi:Helix-turn-helix domain
MNSTLRVHVEHSALSEVAFEKWLTAKQVAAHFGLGESSAYHWVNEGRIPERFIRYRGMRQYLFHPDLLLHLKKLFQRSP